MAVSLSSLERSGEVSAPNIVIYGVAGVGKTTLAAQAPKPVFIRTEDGLGKNQIDAFPLAKSMDDVMDAISALYTEIHDFNTVIVDSIDWLEPLIWARVCEEKGVDSIETFGYGKGYNYALDIWRDYLEGLTALRKEKNMAVIQIGHAIIKRFDSPETDSYDRYELKLHTKASSLVQENADGVFFANYKVATTKSEVGFDKKRTRAVGNGERVLYTQERPAFLAKNRYEMPESIPMDWNNLEQFLNGQIEKEQNDG